MRRSLRQTKPPATCPAKFDDEDYPVYSMGQALKSLFTDIVGMWRRKDLGAGLILAAGGGNSVAVQPDSPPTGKVSGPLAGVVR